MAMANWCNARLIVVGERQEVLNFGRLARARPSSFFGPDMLRGEGMDLEPDRIQALQAGAAKKKYRFQIRNSDGRRHFCRVSKQFPALCFVLVHMDLSDPPNGSYFIRRGRFRTYMLPDELCEAVMTKNGCTDDPDSDEPWCYWDASWELMDMAEAYWQQALLKTLNR
jgi:hypothetical protein